MESKNKYNNSKIYKLVLKQGIEPNEDYKEYIGSTVQPLIKRLQGHKCLYKLYLDGKSTYCSSYKLFQDYNIENIQIILIEEINCENKEQLLKRERYHIELNNTINKIIPTRTKKEWYEEYKDEILEKAKDYYNDKGIL